ncbi:hypothetical protein [Arenibacter sp. NBRC 103722]|uniref:hypothetical protein n=1 Tax=Arenibacter sp. NBRC 103722 TaxID=1113929 RepID=UPI0011AF5FDD|nr:hypothetical protein [Arenibacter sp. NBRC 103722]MDX1767953.1 hypothetical protein [Arenibacter troitsensis]
MKFILNYFILRTPTNTLSDLDLLFENTISNLPIDSQIAYCQRLIERSQYYLKRTNNKERSAHLEKLIKAAEIEIGRLSN